MLLALVVYLLEKFLAGKFLTCTDDPGDTLVLNLHDVLLATFAAKLEFDLRAAHFGVTIFHCGQAV